MSVTLRPYQTAALSEARKHIQLGRKRVLVTAPTGSGKTSIAGAMISSAFHRGKQSLFLAHRKELLEQCHGRLAEFGVDASILQANDSRIDLGKPVQVASVQTLVRRLDRFSRDAFDLIVVDECFPAGTLVDGKPIEKIGLNDELTAYSPSQGFSKQAVLWLFKKKPTTMCTVKTAAGSVACTPGHPFFTKDGWKLAGGLTNEDEVLVYDVPMHRVRNADTVADQGPNENLVRRKENVLHKGRCSPMTSAAAIPMSDARGFLEGAKHVLGNACREEGNEALAQVGNQSRVDHKRQPDAT